MYRDRTTGNLCVTFSDIRSARPDISLPEIITDAVLDEVGFDPVTQTSAPSYDPLTQGVRSTGYSLVGTQWTQTWEVYQLSADEIAAGKAALIAQYTAALDSMFDLRAKEKNYDNRITCALRAGYAGPFQAEGQAFAVWMDNCNALAYKILAAVEAGTQSLPTVSQFLAQMPSFSWPVAA